MQNMEQHLKHFALLALTNPHNPYSEDAKGDIHCFDDKELFRYTMFVVTECIYIMAKQQKDMSPEKLLGAEMCADAIQKEFKCVMDKVVVK
jgi:hypothetical protein